MPRFNIHHITRYTYDSPVRDSANQVILFPINDEFQEVLKHELTITGSPPIETYKDYYGNEVGIFTHAAAHQSLVIDSRLEIVTRPRPGFSDTATNDDQWDWLEQARWKLPFVDFLQQEAFGQLPEALETVCPGKFRSLTPLAAARELTTYVYTHFKYIKGITSVETTLDEVWELKAGVCQDFAHILLVFLRQIGIPARYVSGYICPNQNGMRGEGATHAWIEAYIPFTGWVGFDPTNNCEAKDLHVRLAVGRNFSDCSPVRGTYKGAAGHQLEVAVSVSYENDRRPPETVPAFHSFRNDEPSNSYRRNLEMMQQQQ